MHVKNITFNIFYNKINHVLQKILNKLNYQDSNLLNAIKYSLLSNGKRIRPLLVYSTGKMLKVHNITLNNIAAAIECIHAYSLIHDDLPSMDNNNLRRGHPTCHIKYGENIAILAGNALHALAFSILSEELMPKINSNIRLKMISELASTSGFLGMCYGQELDLLNSNKITSLETLNKINHHKTSLLIRSSIRLVALASQLVNNDILKILDDYANNIGLAFQIQDDILDIIGDISKLGKNPGSDILLKKNTYPKILGLEKSKIKSEELYQQAINSLEKLKKQSFNVSKLKKIATFIIKRDR